MKQKLLTLEQADEYRSLVANYHPNGQVVVDFARSKFAVIAGPTGAGKDTIRNELIKDSVFVKVLSTTSRPPRDGEIDGHTYHFRNLQFFDEGMDQRRFLQVALVHNQQLSCLDFNDIASLSSDQTGLAILVVQTEIELRRLNPDLKTVFVVPPDLGTLIGRIKQSHGMDDQEIARRLNSAKTELEIALKQPSYFCIINDDINRAVGSVRSYFSTGTFDTNEDQLARQAILRIINEL